MEEIVGFILEADNPGDSDFTPNESALYMRTSGEVFHPNNPRVRMDAQDAYVGAYDIEELPLVYQETWYRKYSVGQPQIFRC